MTGMLHSIYLYSTLPFFPHEPFLYGTVPLILANAKNLYSLLVRSRSLWQGNKILCTNYHHHIKVLFVLCMKQLNNKRQLRHKKILYCLNWYRPDLLYMCECVYPDHDLSNIGYQVSGSSTTPSPTPCSWQQTNPKPQPHERQARWYGANPHNMLAIYTFIPSHTWTQTMYLNVSSLT